MRILTRKMRMIGRIMPRTRENTRIQIRPEREE
jgi:hypothetical protein